MKNKSAYLFILLMTMCLCGCARDAALSSQQDTGSSIATSKVKDREKTDELNFKKVNKISTYVLSEECFSSEESLINDIKGIMSRLSPNDMDELPKSEDGVAYEGGWTELNVYKDNELLYSLLLFQAEGIQVVKVNQEEASSYYDIGEEDKELFHDIYSKIYDENSK